MKITGVGSQASTKGPAVRAHQPTPVSDRPNAIAGT